MRFSCLALLAHDLRDHYATPAASTGAKSPSTADAYSTRLLPSITQILNEFHTFDETGDARHLGLLPTVFGEREVLTSSRYANPKQEARNSTFEKGSGTRGTECESLKKGHRTQTQKIVASIR